MNKTELLLSNVLAHRRDLGVIQFHNTTIKSNGERETTLYFNKTMVKAVGNGKVFKSIIIADRREFVS